MSQTEVPNNLVLWAGIHGGIHDHIHASVHGGIHDHVHLGLHTCIHEGVHESIHEKPPRLLDRMPDVPTKQVLRAHLIPQGVAPRPSDGLSAVLD